MLTDFRNSFSNTIRYEMLFLRALESRHESALSNARNRQLKSVKIDSVVNLQQIHRLNIPPHHMSPTYGVVGYLSDESNVSTLPCELWMSESWRQSEICSVIRLAFLSAKMRNSSDNLNCVLQTETVTSYCYVNFPINVSLLSSNI